MEPSADNANPSNGNIEAEKEPASQRETEVENAANGDPTGGSGSGQKAEEQRQLSKNQQKKLMKQQMNRERREAKREGKKKDREAAEEARRKAIEEARSKMTPEERAAAEERSRELQQQRQKAQEEKLAEWKKALEGSPRVIMDLGFEDLMSTRELASLQQQVMYSYGQNTRSTKPLRLTLTSCCGKILENLERISGFDNWRIDRHAESYIDTFAADKDSLIYLTSDADEELTALEPDKSYIIGGIVDHNRHKNVTLNKSKEQGIKAARLPSSCFPTLTTSKVLTVNQVFEILLGFWSNKNWSESIHQAIPDRKKTRGADEELEGGERKKQKSDA